MMINKEQARSVERTARRFKEAAFVLTATVEDDGIGVGSGHVADVISEIEKAVTAVNEFLALVEARTDS